MLFKNEIIKILKKEIKDIDPNLIEVPPNREMGDYALPCFSLSNKYKIPPQDVAKLLFLKLKPTSLIEKIVANGPYLNFSINSKKRNSMIIKKIIKEKLNYGFKKKNKKVIVIEFPSPNTNKPLHLGHLRNMALGESISRIIASQGFKIVRVNLNNDRGIHICKSMLAYKKWGNNQKPNKKTDHFVGDFYVLFSQKLKKDPNLEEEVKNMLKEWEFGKFETRELWKKMNSWALKGFNETYKRFGINFDKVYYESKIYEDGKKLVLNGLKKGFFKKDNTGAVIINLGEKLGEKVLIRADGTSIYITQDLYLAKLKYDDYKFYKSIYVVGNEQNYHFEVLIKLLEILGYKFYKDCYHLSYGMVMLPEGRMKSREGKVIDADNLMDEVFKLVKDEIIKKHNLSEKKIKSLSEKIGLAAIKYLLLRYSAQKDFTFNPEESISFEGETGPYLQYSLVRAKKIQEKGNIPNSKIDFSILDKEEENLLIQKLSEYPDIITKSAIAFSPHILTEYGHQLASLFNKFYENCQVLSAETEELKKARLQLINSFIWVLTSCLLLLGIDSVDVM